MERVKRFALAFLATGILLSNGSCRINVYAKDESSAESADLSFGTYVSSETLTVEQLLKQARWLANPSGGHGFAAEEANNLIDQIQGNDSFVIGGDNLINGPDRILIGRDGTEIFIQDKYYSTANNSIKACFGEDGYYRYVNGDGSPMIVEVPADQYDECVQLMKTKIADGKVAGVTDVNEAENLVKKGNITYEQAVNLTKAGNIDSLVYDAANSCVTAATAFGIGATIDFVLRLHNGEDKLIALKESAVTGLKTGSTAFAISVITLQLSKTALINAFTPGANALVNTFGDSFANALIKAYGVNKFGMAARTAAVNILKTQALAQTVTLVVLTLPEVAELIEGRISTKQLIKNVSIAAAGIVGGSLGFFAGSSVVGVVLPGAGNVIGGFAGSFAGGALASYLVGLGFDQFIVSDAEEMMDIIEEEFCKLGEAYLITENEAVTIVDKLGTIFTEDTLKDMFASKERSAFAHEKLEPLFEEVTAGREHISVPDDIIMRNQLKESLEGVVFIH